MKGPGGNRPPGRALTVAVDALWALPHPAPADFMSGEAFKAVQMACAQEFGEAANTLGAVFALANAIRSLGPPCQQADPTAQGTAAAAAAGLAQCFQTGRRTLVHLCPLDLADTLPAFRFGRARITGLSAADLTAFIDPVRLQRWGHRWRPDAERLSHVQWLVVEEEVDGPSNPGRRASAFLYQPVSEWGRPPIEPHAPRFPPAVQEALFLLLLAPWEDWTEVQPDEWRGFQLGWTQTADPDLAQRPVAPPSLDTLTWVPEPREGNEDHERLAHRFLDPGAAALPAIVAKALCQLDVARTSPLMDTPVAHFLVTGFAAQGIDEFMAHITVVEAALGLVEDYPRKGRPKPTVLPNIRSVGRLSCRLVALLKDEAVETTLDRLFELRSRFVHGRAMESVPIEALISARRLARRVAAALLDLAASDPTATREAVLEGLLLKGAKMLDRSG